jgi:hypothetical protein
MTEKAKKILEGMRKRYQLRMSNPSARERVLNDFNHNNLDDVGPVAGKQQMKVLEDMNSLDREFEEHIQSLRPNVSTY